MARRYWRVKHADEFKSFAPHMLETLLHRQEQKVIYQGKTISIWGDLDKAFEVLDQLRIAMREPGVDDAELPEGCDTSWSPDLDGNRIMFDVEASEKFEHQAIEYFMKHHKLEEAKDYWDKLKASLPWGFMHVQCIQKKIAETTFVIVPAENEMVEVPLPDGTKVEVPFLSMRKEAELAGYDIEQRADEIGVRHLLEAEIIPFVVPTQASAPVDEDDGHPGGEIIPFPGAAPQDAPEPEPTEETGASEEHDDGLDPSDTS
jgi:hypothetical protein